MECDKRATHPKWDRINFKERNTNRGVKRERRGKERN